MDYINIRTMIDAMGAYKVFEKTLEMLAERPAYRECFKDIDIKDILKNNTLDYLLCIAACDKELTFDEKENISGLANLSMQYDDMKQRIKDKNLTSEEFYTTPPEILRILHSADIAYFGFGGIYDNAYYSNMLIRFYRLIGDVLVYTDKYISPQKLDVYDTYIESMREYIVSNRPF